jgi:hypothetical protein
LNKKADAMISIMQKPENKFLKIMELIGNVATIIGVLAVVEIIRNWMSGG